MNKQTDAMQGRPDRARLDLVHRLAQQIRAVEKRPGSGGIGLATQPPVATGWAQVDRALSFPSIQPPRRQTTEAAGLARGALHEWLGVEGASDRRQWAPPLCLLTHLSWQAVSQDRACGGRVLWIGRCCWPHPRLLIRDGDRRLLRRSIFVDPPDAASGLWAMDLALRSRAVTAVVAAGRSLRLAATRRLQLAAEAGRALALLARPPDEMACQSAAATRWLVRTGCGSSSCRMPARPDRPGGCGSMPGQEILDPPVRAPRWIVELRRCKAQQIVSRSTRWVLEWNRGNFAVLVSADLVGRPGQAPPAHLVHKTV